MFSVLAQPNYLERCSKGHGRYFPPRKTNRGGHHSYANRPIARRLLAGASALNTSLGELRVISSEGLIGFKLQGWINNPRRTQDLEDIRALLRANREQLDMTEVRGYFQFFDREVLLDEILSQLG